MGRLLAAPQICVPAAPKCKSASHSARRATGGPLAPELKYAHAEVASLVTAPLPGALALLGAGLGALGLMRRRG